MPSPCACLCSLVVPVIRNAESLSFADVEKTLAALALKARNNQIAIEDMVGGTFTISNGGVFGSMMGTPIINPPQVRSLIVAAGCCVFGSCRLPPCLCAQSAILGMHATKNRPVAVDGKVEIRPVMYLALTYDHRLIDGRCVAAGPVLTPSPVPYVDSLPLSVRAVRALQRGGDVLVFHPR